MILRQAQDEWIESREENPLVLSLSKHARAMGVQK